MPPIWWGGAPHQKTNTRACGLVSQTTIPNQTSQPISKDKSSQSSQNIDDTEGGGGGVYTPTGTECNIVLETDKQTDDTPSVYYETDEEEFTRPGSTEPTFHQKVSAKAQTPSSGAPKYRNTAKRKVKPKACPGYNLSYSSMWWKRMDHEGKRKRGR